MTREFQIANLLVAAVMHLVVLWHLNPQCGQYSRLNVDSLHLHHEAARFVHEHSQHADPHPMKSNSENIASH